MLCVRPDLTPPQPPPPPPTYANAHDASFFPIDSERERCFLPTYISLWDGTDPANTERFQGSDPLLPHLCSLSVPKVGVCGVYSESP